MANRMSDESAKELESHVRKIIKLASRKKGVSGEEICKALNLLPDFMGYRYRRALKEAKARGLRSLGQGPSARWHM